MATKTFTDEFFASNPKGAATPSGNFSQKYFATPKINVALDPTTRQINISAPQSYLDSPEFKEQVLPYFQQLEGKDINDNDFKTLLNSGFVNQLNEQAKSVEQRTTSIDQYKRLFPKASDQDALLYFRNVAAADRSDQDANTQIVTANAPDGTIKTQSVADIVANFDSQDDNQKATYLKKITQEIDKPESEQSRAIASSIYQFLDKKGKLQADTATKINEGARAFLANSDKNIGGWVFNQLTRPINALAGQGDKTAADLYDRANENNANLSQLQGIDEARTVGNITSEITNVIADIPIGGALGKVATRGGQAVKTILENKAPLAVIEATGRGTQVADKLAEIPGGASIANATSSLAKQAPADIGFGVAHAATNTDYDAGSDFLVNTLFNAGGLAAFKAGSKGLQAFDAAAKSDGVIGQVNRATSQTILKGVDKFQKIPIIGERTKRLSENLIDDAGAYRRTFRNAFAYAGPDAEKAKVDYQTAYNLSRTAAMRGKKLGDNFIQDTPEFYAAADLRKSFDDTTLKEANRYVELQKNIAYAEAGRRPTTNKQLESMKEEFAGLQNRPEFTQYQENLNTLNAKITDLSNEIGLTDEDILKTINENPDLKDSYVYLQYENETLNKNNVLRGQTQARKAKGVQGLKGEKKDANLVDPLLAAQDRVYFLANEKAKNDLVKHLVNVATESGLPGVRVARSAEDVRRFDSLKYEAKQEKEFIDNAVNVAVDDLGGDLAMLADDLEDFAGTGLSAMNARIGTTVDDMVDSILAEPKLQNGVDELMQSVGDGQDNAADIAALGILQRQKNHLAKTVESKLSDLSGEDRKAIVDMFKENITTRFDDATGNVNGVASKELYKRRDEIKQLRKDIEPISATTGENFIPYYDKGARGIVEIDDPNLVKYFMSSRSQAEMGLIGKIAMNSSRLFRAGTTGLNPEFALAVNPSRDFLQATISSGAGILSPRNVVADLMETQGVPREVAEQIAAKHAKEAKEYIDYGTQIEVARDPRSSKKASKALDKTLRKGEAANTDSKITMLKLRGRDALPSQGTFRALEDAMSQVEVVTRKNTYTAAYSAAVKRGASPDAAQQEALFQAANATTDFVNVGGKIDNMLKTLPYLSAAINGKASFIRLATLDPVGTAVRLGYGVATPALWLTMHNLSDPDRAATYDKLSEYEKNTNFVIVLGKDNVLKIPLSYELASAINPYRQIVEDMQNGEDIDVMESFMDAVLSASPIDASGFTEEDIYGNRDPKLGVSRLAAALLPQVARPVYETASGQNLYTGGDNAPTDQELYDRGQIAPGETIEQSDRTYASRNSRILGGIADMINVPQSTIQNLLSSYTGKVGDFVVNNMDKLAGAPEDEQGGRDFMDSLAKRFIGNTSSRMNNDYYRNIDKLEGDKELLLTRLAKIDEGSDYSDDPSKLAEDRQNILNEYGEKVAGFAKTFGEYYQRAGGFKPYQLDALVDLLNLGPEAGTFAEGTYQQGMLNDVRQEASNEATRRATDIGLPATSNRDLYGRMFNNNGEQSIDYSNTNLYNDNIRSAVYGAPKQIAYDFEQVTKADKKNGIQSLYDIKRGFDDRISALYDEAAKVPTADKARKTAIFDEISEVQKEYMTKFDERIEPIIRRYGVESLAESKVFDELSGFIVVPGEMTPYFSKKKTPYLKSDAKAYLLDRYGVGKINQRNRMTDPEVAARVEEINLDLQSGRTQAANYKLTNIERQINDGKVFVDGDTMANIADMVYNLNSYKKKGKK